MPKRHGFCRLDENGRPWFRAPWFLVGIDVIFSAVARHDFVTSGPLKAQAASLKFHFDSIKTRLMHAIDLFQQSISELECFYDTGSTQPEIYVGPCTAEVTADSILSYISIFADDVGRVIPFALEGRATQFNSFTKLKTGIVDNGRYPVLHALFARLETAGSWWDLSLRFRVGARQRLTHYTDVIMFQGAKGPSDDKVLGQAFILDPFSGTSSVDFIGTLRLILLDLCNWLDDLEQVLSAVLSARSTAEGIAWALPPDCPRVRLPVDLRAGERTMPDDYLYLPLCDGSLPSRRKFVGGSSLDPKS
jgi:hypothetical protein